MPRGCVSLAVLALAVLSGGPAARADLLSMTCQAQKGPYMIRFDTESGALARHDKDGVHPYKVVRKQFESGDALVWGVTRAHGGDMLAFFGSKTMVKYFFGNGSETTEICAKS